MDHLVIASFSFIRFPGSSPFICELLFYYILFISTESTNELSKYFSVKITFPEKHTYLTNQITPVARCRSITLKQEHLRGILLYEPLL